MRTARIVKCLIAGSVLLLAASSMGCGGGKPQGAEVKGTITYKGAPVTGGSIKFHYTGGEIPGSLNKDGQFSVTGVPEGEVTITVDTSNVKSFAPGASSGPPGGGKMTPDMERKMKEQQAKMKSASDKMPNVGGSEVQYVEIPKKYKDKNTSTLKKTIGSGRVDLGTIELTD